MIEQALWQFLEYGKRKQAVIIVTIITGLVAVWPAADEYMAARERIRSAQSELEESRQQVDKLPQFTQMFEKRNAELKDLEERTVTRKAAQLMRDEVTSIARREGCRMERLVLGGELRRDWTENDAPVNHTAIVDRGGDTPYQLVTRQMTVSMEGSMKNVKQFLSELHDLKRMIHTKSISLSRNSLGKMDVNIDLLMFDLVKKTKT